VSIGVTVVVLFVFVFVVVVVVLLFCFYCPLDRVFAVTYVTFAALIVGFCIPLSRVV
jgi:hypothetical protein